MLVIPSRVLKDSFLWACVINNLTLDAFLPFILIISSAVINGCFGTVPSIKVMLRYMSLCFARIEKYFGTKTELMVSCVFWRGNVWLKR